MVKGGAVNALSPDVPIYDFPCEVEHRYGPRSERLPFGVETEDDFGGSVCDFTSFEGRDDVKGPLPNRTYLTARGDV